jgi:hypothetical protein
MLYSYAWNNALRLKDPTGEYVIQEGQNSKKVEQTRKALQEVVGKYGKIETVRIGKTHTQFTLKQTREQYDKMMKGGNSTKAVRDLSSAMADKHGVFYIYNATVGLAESKAERKNDLTINKSRQLDATGGASTDLDPRRKFARIRVVADIAINYDKIPTEVPVAGGLREARGEMTQQTPGLTLGHELLGHGFNRRLHGAKGGSEAQAMMYENRFLRAPRGLPPRLHDVVK